MITVESGELFAVELPANPSTGYQWSVVQVPDAVELVEEHVAPPAAGTTAAGLPAAVGSSSSQKFTFMAKHTGETEIRFELKRAWESEPIDSRTFTVVVA
ncbi:MULTISPECIES: protease inhibitor I42 family protein [Arthrobacter]|uniref:Protease inhibitor I42 family protein n=2 Tax=Arthrobacter TaxID=1663 RepID=A0ABU9KFS0_9MICC|nr:protease inhibitor I42 family protein [Arthrobacter sp. YJM1]MDP5225726.1 protease inhibitor I42 family protein [Arthrobacter sp. YJM1]